MQKKKSQQMKEDRMESQKEPLSFTACEQCKQCQQSPVFLLLAI